MNVLGSLSNTHSRNELHFRRLQPIDQQRTQELHEICLPVRYNASFYQRIVSPHSSLLTAVCLDDDLIVGIAVARTEDQSSSRERGIVDCQWGGQELVYVMTLVVDPSYRRRSIGSQLLEYIATQMPESVKAICLHVLDSNISAQQFYHRNGFTQGQKLTDFYRIEGRLRNAYLYVMYVNGGHAPSQSFQNYCIMSAQKGATACPWCEDIWYSVSATFRNMCGWMQNKSQT